MIKCISFLLLAVTITLIVFRFNRTPPSNLTGVYWGAFDPPTEAHAAIIIASLKDIPLKKLILVVNNHPYKNYTYSLETRLQMIREIILLNGLENVELRWQDENYKLDFLALKQLTKKPLCAIAGYDAYKKWVEYSTPHERSLYDAIAVIPRGNDSPILYDEIAFILPINSIYEHVSSTKVRASLCRKIVDTTCNNGTELNVSTNSQLINCSESDIR